MGSRVCEDGLRVKVTVNFIGRNFRELRLHTQKRCSLQYMLLWQLTLIVNLK